MNEPIFARLEHDLGDALHHLAHHDQQIPSQPDKQEAAMTDAANTTTAPAGIDAIIAKGQADLAEAVNGARSWAAEIETRGARTAQAALGPITMLANNKVARFLVENELHVPDALVETAIGVLKAFAAAAPASTPAA